MITNEIYAQLALRVYAASLVDEDQDKSNRPRVPNGWTEVSWQVDNSAGFSYGVYRNSASGEVVVSYSGTMRRLIRQKTSTSATSS